MQRKQGETLHSMIDNILCEIIETEVQSEEVALLASGGIDSLSLGFAAHRLGKKVSAYTFHLEDDYSYDAKKAEEAADKMGWEINTTVVPKTNLEQDFFNLLHKYKCKRKTSFECTFPFVYLYPKVKQKYIMSGIGADGFHGMSKKCILNFKEPKELFDEFRIEGFKKENYAGVDQQRMLCEEYNKVLVHPYYQHKEVEDYFMQYDWYELNKPEQKQHIRKSFKKELDKVGRIRLHSNLQLESNIDHLFEELIDNNKVNFKRRSRVMDICKDWSLLNTSTNTLESFMQ